MSPFASGGEMSTISKEPLLDVSKSPFERAATGKPMGVRNQPKNALDEPLSPDSQFVEQHRHRPVQAGLHHCRPRFSDRYVQPESKHFHDPMTYPKMTNRPRVRQTVDSPRRETAAHYPKGTLPKVSLRDMACREQMRQSRSFYSIHSV